MNSNEKRKKVSKFNKKDRKGKQRSPFGATSNLSEWLVRGFAFRPIVVPLSFPWLASLLPPHAA